MQDNLELYIVQAQGDVAKGTAAWLVYYTAAKTKGGAPPLPFAAQSLTPPLPSNS